ncbi:MAG: Hsp20/alpha crystallin family protein [Anaerolineae bacterium]|nr:Hsp20/alpha crystallin family protein [Anaerolineae bacterium]
MSMFVYAPYGHHTRRLVRQMVENGSADMQSLVSFPIDVHTDGEAYYISAVIPGVKAEELSIQLVGDTITLEGEFNHERDEKAKYLRMERPSGKFHRTITLPDALDAASVEANLQDGILTLRAPISEQARPKAIKVNSK